MHLITMCDIIKSYASTLSLKLENDNCDSVDTIQEAQYDKDRMPHGKAG